MHMPAVGLLQGDVKANSIAFSHVYYEYYVPFWPLLRRNPRRLEHVRIGLAGLRRVAVRGLLGFLALVEAGPDGVPVAFGGAL